MVRPVDPRRGEETYLYRGTTFDIILLFIDSQYKKIPMSAPKAIQAIDQVLNQYLLLVRKPITVTYFGLAPL